MFAETGIPVLLGLLEVMAVTGAFLLATLHWDQARALTGRGRPDFGVRLKRCDPLSVRARVRLLAAVTTFGIPPYAEEQAEAVSAA